MDGRPDLHAMRVAMLTRRNAVESLFSRLESGYKQTGESGDRSRPTDSATHEALICLSYLSMTAQTLQTLRAKAGGGSGRQQRPKSLADALKMRRAA